MLGQIASRRNVLRFGALAALTAGVAACASTGTTTVSGTASGAPTTVTVTPAQVAAEASTVLTAVSGAVAAFVAANPSGVIPTALTVNSSVTWSDATGCDSWSSR